MPHHMPPWHKLEFIHKESQIGCCYLTIRSPEMGRVSGCLYLHHLLVDPLHRNKGVGTGLVEWCKEIAAAEKLDVLLYALEVDTGRQADLIRLYSRLGFKRKWDDNDNYMAWSHKG
jgi:GNAT superfamily N-acetyltransferase